MPSPLLIDYLNRSRAVYELKQHAPAVTAAEAVSLHGIPMRQFAKSVLVRVDGALAMVIVPANYQVALEPLRRALAASRVALARERQFGHRFPRCELGAMPPFGHLFGLNAYAAPLFNRNEEIVFKAGSHSESVRMPFPEFQRLAHFDAIEQGVVPQLCRPALPLPDLHDLTVPGFPYPAPASRQPLIALRGR